MTAQKDIAEAGLDDLRYQELRANAYSLVAHLLSAAPNEATLQRLLGITTTDSEIATNGSGSLAPAWRAFDRYNIELHHVRLAHR